MTAMFLITVVIFVLMPTIAVVMQANLGMVAGRVIESASPAFRKGDDVIAIGNALALPGGPTVTRGIVSALDRSSVCSSTLKCFADGGT